jgi:hypothetical protein
MPDENWKLPHVAKVVVAGNTEEIDGLLEQSRKAITRKWRELAGKSRNENSNTLKR